MSSVNKVILVGHTGQAPELKYMTNGDAVANVSLATSEQWKDKNTGEKKENTEWHRLVFYRRLAEVVGEHVGKGTQLYVEGSLKTRKWTDKDGVERVTTEVIVDDMKFLGKPQDGKGEGHVGGARHAPKSKQPPAQMDDDYPF